MLTSSAIKAQARTLGFDLCGIAPATGMPELARIHDWIARGHHGDLRYLERSADVRGDVARFLPGARSVVMTASNYFTGPDPTPAPSASVARYARGQDYHLVLQDRLEGLLAWMREQAEHPFEAAVFVDKHWVQERVVAAYAGLGWIGKHSLLINPRSARGSYWPGWRPRCRSRQIHSSPISAARARCASTRVPRAPS